MKRRNILFALILMAIVILSSCNNVTSDKSDNSSQPTDIIVEVNGDYILKSEIDPVYQQYVDTKVTYEKIVEDTISEILVIQQAEKYNIEVSDKELEDAVADYEIQQPQLYKESLAMYGEGQLKRKLKDTALFNKTKKYVLNNVIVINDNIVNAFKNQKEFNGYLDGKSNQEILIALNNEIKQYAFSCWIKDLRKDAKIIYY